MRIFSRFKRNLALTCAVLFCCALVLSPTPRFLVLAHSQVTQPRLGTAGNFAVLGASTVTNTGSTVVAGDLGVSPGTAVTGFPPGNVTGTIHAADTVAQQAQNDIAVAYANAAGQTCDGNLTGQDLGDKTLTPGVYCFSSSAQLTGQLRLDSQGNPARVFIFQIGSTLTTASNATVLSINGTQVCNVFWQVGSSATLGTNTNFAGNILALTSITATTGTTSNGSLYARNGAVTLDTNTITRSPCGASGSLTFTSDTGITYTDLAVIPGSRSGETAVPPSIPLTGVDQTIHFKFASNVIDHRGSAAGWRLQATSTGLQLHSGTPLPLNLTGLDPTAGNSSCTGLCVPTVNQLTVNPLSPIPISGNPGTFISTGTTSSTTGGNYLLMTDGNFILPGNAVSGTYTGVITVILVNGF